jgi:hypothetical protein
MHDVAPAVEKALLIGAPRRGTSEAKAVKEHLDELARLLDTAGAKVAGRVVQVALKPSGEPAQGAHEGPCCTWWTPRIRTGRSRRRWWARRWTRRGSTGGGWRWR